MFMEKYIIVGTLPHQPIRDKELGHYEPFWGQNGNGTALGLSGGMIAIWHKICILIIVYSLCLCNWAKHSIVDQWKFFLAQYPDHHFV